MKCTNCSKEISELEKRVRITTFNIDKTSVDEWFHFQCWKDNFNKAVKKKLNTVGENAKKMIEDITKQIDIKGILENETNILEKETTIDF